MRRVREEQIFRTSSTIGKVRCSNGIRLKTFIRFGGRFLIRQINRRFENGRRWQNAAALCTGTGIMKYLSPLFLLLFSQFVFADSIENAFTNPPPAARPHVMWMWMGCNLSKPEITKDLEALKDAGFGGTLMFSVADTTTPWPGEIGKSPTPEIIAFTEPWWKMVRYTAMESQRLGLDFGMAGSPGYSTSGGPWIPPELSMSEVCHSETPAKGPGKIELNLPKPTVDPRGNMHFPVFNPATGKVEKPEIPARKTFYRDIAVLALPAGGVAAKDQVIDLTGKKNWDVPPGEWTIYRFGYTTKGILLQPPQWKANGLECDKLNPDAVNLHMDHVIGEIKKYVGDLIGKGFNFIHVDSYEAGVPEWTPKMREEFAKRRGYDMTPFIATLAKRTVGSKEETDKFRADFKDTIRDLFRDVYYEIIHRKLREAGLVFASEPYGGLWRQEDVVPQVDRLLVEFWTSKGTFRSSNSATIAAQRNTGRNMIEAEAFTGWPTDSAWSEHPAWLKPIGDAAFCAGINRLVLHRYVPQPWDDQYKPGQTMGWWGTHFTHTQTWWEHGKAMVRYWQRCQAVLQWGKFATGPADFTAQTVEGGARVSAIHRAGDGTDVWFVANTARERGVVQCDFAVSGRQPELWDPVTGEMRVLTDFKQTGTATVVPLEFAPAQSFFVVFRRPATDAGERRANTPALVRVAAIEGPWQVQFDPKWGGPEAPVTFETLEDWTKRSEPGIKYFSGTAVYRKTFDTTPGEASWLDLGVVHHTARLRLNGRDLGVIWTAPWGVMIPAGLLKAKGNELEIEVANVWANRLIGDEQEPPDCEWIPGERGNGGSLKEFPDWFLKKQPRPSKGRFTFTTWNYFTKDSPLIPSGMVGPVQLMRQDWTPRAVPDAPAYSERRLSAEGAPVVVVARIFPKREAALENDVPRERLGVTAQDVVTDKSGGADASAVINGTTRNGSGGDETLNDGKTYRGYGQGHSLTLRLDTAKSPAGFDLTSILSFAGHADSRAGQRYSVAVSTVDAPDEFKLLTDVNLVSDGGASEVRMTSPDGKPLVRHAAAVRFDFADGKSGFQVYREFSLVGSPTTP